MIKLGEGKGGTDDTVRKMICARLKCYQMQIVLFILSHNIVFVLFVLKH